MDGNAEFAGHLVDALTNSVKRAEDHAKGYVGEDGGFIADIPAPAGLAGHDLGRQTSASTERGADTLDSRAPVVNGIDLPHKEKAMAVSHEGDASQKTCAYGTSETRSWAIASGHSELGQAEAQGSSTRHDGLTHRSLANSVAPGGLSAPPVFCDRLPFFLRDGAQPTIELLARCSNTLAKSLAYVGCVEGKSAKEQEARIWEALEAIKRWGFAHGVMNELALAEMNLIGPKPEGAQ